ncbi:MAG: hypothetical protein WBE68_11990 [Candidatus Nitrosopolaris sp.]
MLAIIPLLVFTFIPHHTIVDNNTNIKPCNPKTSVCAMPNQKQTNCEYGGQRNYLWPLNKATPNQNER